MSEDAGVFLLSEGCGSDAGVKIWHFDGCARAAVGNFAITSPSFLRRDTSESLTGVHSASKVGNSSITFAPGAGICARGSWLKTGKIFTPLIADRQGPGPGLPNNFPSLIFWLVIAYLSVPFSFHHGGDNTSQ